MAKKALCVGINNLQNYPGSALQGCVNDANLRSRGLYESMLEKGSVHHILWAGCRSDQTSADAYIAGGWHGTFTYYFCKVMNTSKNKLARKDVLKKVRAGLKAGHFNQTAQLECEATKRKAPVA